MGSVEPFTLGWIADGDVDHEKVLYVIHIAWSLHDTKNVWKEVDLESPINLSF